MRLTIIVSDGAVYKDGVAYLGLTWQGTPDNVHALQWYGVEGSIEYKDNSPNSEITELPAWAISAEAAWDAANNPPPPPPPTPEEIKESNKSTAIAKLQETDWAATVDIADPQYSNPYLANQGEFLAYRSEVRAIAVNPPTTVVDPWPVEPTAVWEAAP
jgi:hypothetical protein